MFYEKLKTMLPKFLFAPDPNKDQLYIIHTQEPLAVILVHQTIPAQLLIMECEYYDHQFDDPATELDADEIEILSDMLRDAADWYRQNAIEKTN